MIHKMEKYNVIYCNDINKYVIDPGLKKAEQENI